MPARSPKSRRKPAASSFPTIPSTPISEKSPSSFSSEAVKKRREENSDERIAETPRANMPKRTTQLATANSQDTPFEISSAENSESDCKIVHVSPSPKRNVSAGPRPRSNKRANITERPIIVPDDSESDCILQKVLPSPRRKLFTTSPRGRSAKKARIERRPVVAPDGSDSGCIIEKAPSPKRKLAATNPRGRPAKRSKIEQRPFVVSDDSESDCVIEKVVPSSGGSVDTPVLIESDGDSDSDVGDATSQTEPAQTGPDEDRLTKQCLKKEIQVQDDRLEETPTTPRLENDNPSSTYELQPVYCGERLPQFLGSGGQSPFRPRHRHSIVGLKSILKMSSEKQARDIKPNLPSSLPRDEPIFSTPSLRVDNGDKQAETVLSSERSIS
ncbi:t-complex protein 1 subunit beta [Fusarium flagelliforme]|uniref:T-complex protein 1 subunit beta n=2 Tax=Fusarium flagelliforme TaxID=2675880 RepID=A0A395MQV8_9HYPO|nr:t-complex protein 1 subunit beta [Fusarium flagelliforme]